MKQNLSSTKEQIVFGNDSIVIRKFIRGIEGGKTLDTTGFTNTLIKAGHIIITNGEGTYKPMPLVQDSVTENSVTTFLYESDGVTPKIVYGALPDGYNYCGVLYRTIQTSKPAASILTWGIVNEEALPYAITGIKSAFASAVPHIEFIKEEEA